MNSSGVRLTLVLCFLFLGGGVYAVSTLLVGIIGNRMKPIIMQLVGLFFLSCGLTFVGPSFLFSFLSPRPWFVYASIIVIGVSFALVWTTAASIIISCAVNRGYKSDMSLNGWVSGICLGTTFLSGAVGSPAGGALTAAFSFRHFPQFWVWRQFYSVVCQQLLY